VQHLLSAWLHRLPKQSTTCVMLVIDSHTILKLYEDGT
jgi:hypothetical protein